MRDRRNPSGERQNPHGLKTMRSIGRQARGKLLVRVGYILSETAGGRFKRAIFRRFLNSNGPA